MSLKEWGSNKKKPYVSLLFNSTLTSKIEITLYTHFYIEIS